MKAATAIIVKKDNWFVKSGAMLILAFIGQISLAQRIVVITSPSLYQVVGDTIPVRVLITTSLPLDSVTATVRHWDGQAWMQKSIAGFVYETSSGIYSNVISLDGFPNDTLHISVAAWSSTNGVGVTSIEVIHDSLLHILPGLPPGITVSQPLPYSVARPLQSLKVNTNAGTDSVRLVLSMITIIRPASVSYAVIGTWLDSIETVLDFSKYEGASFMLVVQAIDLNNQVSSTAPIPVFVESSPYLKQFFETQGKILDFNYNRVLVINDGPLFNPNIVEVATGYSNPVPYNGHLENGYLTPAGAVFTTPIPGLACDSLFDYNNGIIYPLGKIARGSVKVAGNYFIWSKNDADSLDGKDSLFLRNTTQRTNTLIAHNASRIAEGMRTKSDVTAGGVVVYSDSGNNLVRYENNNYTAITNLPVNVGRAASNPLTDGFNTAYQERNRSYFVAKTTGVAGEAVLYDGFREHMPAPGIDYQVNNQYVAYINIPIDAPVRSELRLRDSTGSSFLVQSGNVRQYTLDLLNPAGDIMYFNHQIDSPVRFIAPRNGPVSQISSSLGKTYYRDSGWYVVIGRVLFKTELSIPPDHINNASLTTEKDFVYEFVAADFTDQYTGPGQLINIKITGLPKKGELKNAGLPVALNDEIVRADLSQLRYTPDAGFVGMDTVYWNASNGIIYTAADAALVMWVVTRPEKPVLEGLKAGYCSNDGIQKIKLTNYPDTSKMLTVDVLLDTTRLSIVAGDSSFSIDPAGLSAGMHTLTAIYRNGSVAAIDTQHFNIIKAVIPIVDLSADIVNVTNLAIPVTLTAENVTGGGSDPLYAFAKDRSFTSMLQDQSSNNTLVIDAMSLLPGINRIYVRMLTSELCYTVQTSVDSVDIRRDPSTGIIDPDYPGSVIVTYPNPFKNRVIITGLNSTEKYRINLYSVNGLNIVSRQVSNQNSLEIFSPQLPPGVYFLTIYKEKDRKLLGAIRLIKKQDE